MRICVVGPGALGSIFAALLADAGHDVSLLAGREAYVEAARKHGGIRLVHEGVERVVNLHITCDPTEIAPVNLALVLVKSTHTAAIAPKLKQLLAPGGLVLTLQNGLTSAGILAEHVGAEHLLVGTTTAGGTLLEPGYVSHTQNGDNFIGWYLGPESRQPFELVEAIARLLHEAGFSCHAEADMRLRVWEKLLVNIGINAVAALTGALPGQIRTWPPTLALSLAAIAEAMLVARAEGVALRADFPERFSKAGKDGRNRPSMWQDVQAKRPTEIMAINGAIGALARKHGIACPVNDTLVALIQTIECGYQA